MAQNHLHLARTLNGNPEYAPEYQWSATQREDVSEGTVTLVYSINGQFTPYVLSDANGPVLFQNWRYQVKVEETPTETLAQRIEALKDMNGRVVFLVDFVHPDDGEDHTDYVQRVFCRVGEFPPDHPTLLHFYVNVELTDATL